MNLTPQRVKRGHLPSENIKLILKSILERFEHFAFWANYFRWWLKLEINPKKSHENRISLENIQTNMKVGGLASIFQVCIVHFLVFWGPSKFGLKRYWG